MESPVAFATEPFRLSVSHVPQCRYGFVCTRNKEYFEYCGGAKLLRAKLSGVTSEIDPSYLLASRWVSSLRFRTAELLSLTQFPCTFATLYLSLAWVQVLLYMPMAAPEVNDPFLQSIVQASDSLRDQTLALLELVNEQHATSQGEGREATLTPDTIKHQKVIASGVAKLRNQNRHLAHLVRDTKATTSISRAEVDRLHLGLQNLYYEERHLVGEIAGCEEYIHPYTQLPLISREDFLTKYPEWESRVNEEGEENGERGLMRARILEEKRGREELLAERTELAKRKQELVKENSKRKEDLGNLDKQLEAFIEVY